MKLKKKLISLASVLAVSAACMTSALMGTPTSAVDDTNDDWLHAVGSRLYDKDGNEVWLTGANWFGFNCSENCAHYLWSADIDDVLKQVADRGINIIRFPISTELIMSWMDGKPNPVSSVSGNADPAFTINPDFVLEDGKTLKDSMQIFDVIMGKLKKYGIKAFVDIHSPHSDNSGHNYNLWYGKETAGGKMVTTDIWIDTLVWLADKYKNDDTLLAYDLKNEPHGKGQEGVEAAKWDGSTDENNWAYAATKCADAILDVNPNALILIEGVEQSLSGAMEGDYWGIADRRDNSPYIGAWWGGNFRGAREFPIKPKHGTSQIVYSPHDYGPSVYAQTWFDKDFTEQTLLDDYWYDTWAYINAEDIAPELIGEWGGHMDGAENQKWMELLRDYMIKHHINHTFWCLNTNSGDTGGLWDDLGFQAGTGTTIKWNEPKYELFEKSLWQTKSGKYIGLDHQVALGANGMSLSEYYSSGEGSNLDSAGSTDPKPPVEVPTDKPATTTTTTATQASSETTTTTATTENGNSSSSASTDTSSTSSQTTTTTTTTTTTSMTTSTTNTTTTSTTASDNDTTTSSETTATSSSASSSSETTKSETSKTTAAPVSSSDTTTTSSTTGNNNNTSKDTTASKPDNTTQSSESTTTASTTTTTTTTKKPTNPEGPSIGNTNATKYGDVNCDGKVNVSDVVALNLYLLNSVENKLDEVSLANADCAKDNHINTSDGTLLMNYVAEIVSYDELGK